MNYIPSDKKADPADFPRLGFDGKMILRELEFQVMENSSLSVSEREWFNVLRNKFLSCVEGYEADVDTAYMRGVVYANEMVYGRDESA